MSVRKYERKQGHLEVLTRANILAQYTLRICTNDKIFPKKARWMMSNRIVNEALDAFGCIKRANALPLFHKERSELQAEAKSHLECLLSYMDLAYDVYNIPTRKIAYWTELVVMTEDKLKHWVESDRKRKQEENRKKKQV